MNHLIAAALPALILTATPALAKDVVVQMKNSGAAGMMVFEPAYVKVDVGDTVRFVPTNPGHNAETIDGMLPPGVPASAGAMNKEFLLKVTKPGLYGIKCKPHLGLGMVALVQAGAPVNKAAAATVKLPPLAAKRMTPMLASAR